MSSSGPRRPDVPRNLKPYFVCLLRKGPRWNITDGNEDLMPKYLAWLHRETDGGRIVFAGPVTDGSDLIGMAMLNAANPEDAATMAGANPGVDSGHFIVEIHPCYLPSLDGVKVEY